MNFYRSSNCVCVYLCQPCLLSELLLDCLVRVPRAYVNPLHPNISMYIFHTVFYTFPKVLTRRICLSIEKIFSW